MSQSGDRQIPKRTGLGISKQYYNYIQKFQYFYIDRSPYMRPDLEASGFHDFARVNSFTYFEILVEMFWW
jgi:hypothetical protein